MRLWQLAIACVPLLGATGCRDAARPTDAAPPPAVPSPPSEPRYSLAKQAGRHWLLAPDGSRFVPIGMNHLGVALQPAGVGRSLTADERAARLGQMRQDLREWHFNTLGYSAPAELYDEFPFIAAVEITQAQHFRTAETAEYADVFDPRFHDHVRRRVKEVCERTGHNPRCIGYWWTDTPRWDLDIARRVWGKTWVRSIRALPDGAPGRARYADFLRGPGPHDDRAFLGLIARELYSVTAAAFRDHAPGRLLFGERYKLGDHPPEVLAEAVQVVDAISVQPGPEVGPLPGPGREEREFDAGRFDALHDRTGKPIVICDHQVSFHDPAFPVTLWDQFPTQTAAADCYAQFLHDAFARPYVVGHFRCQYWSQWMPAPRNLLKQGLRQRDGQPYPEVIRRVAAINRRQLSQLRGAE